MKNMILALVMIMASASNASAVNETKEQCESIGKSHIRETVTVNGNVRRSHCRKKRAKKSDADKIAALQLLKAQRPDLAKQIDAAIKRVKN